MIFNPRDLAYLGSAQSTGATVGIIGSGYSGGGDGLGCYTWDNSTQTLTLISSSFFTSSQAGSGGSNSGNADGFIWSGADYESANRSTLWNGTTVSTNTGMPWNSLSSNGGGQAGGSGDHATCGGGYYKGTNWHATWNGSSWASGKVLNMWARSPVGAMSETGNSIAAGGYGSVSGSGGLNNCTVGGSGSGSGTSGGNGSGAYGQISNHIETRGGADRSGGESWTARTSLTNYIANFATRAMVGDGDEALQTGGYSNCTSYIRLGDNVLWNGSGGTWTTKNEAGLWASGQVNMGETDNSVFGGGYGNTTEGTSGQGYRTELYAWNGSTWSSALSQTLPTGLTRDIGEVEGTMCCMTPDP